MPPNETNSTYVVGPVLVAYHDYTRDDNGEKILDEDGCSVFTDEFVKRWIKQKADEARLEEATAEKEKQLVVLQDIGANVEHSRTKGMLDFLKTSEGTRSDILDSWANKALIHVDTKRERELISLIKNLNELKEIHNSLVEDDFNTYKLPLELREHFEWSTRITSLSTDSLALKAYKDKYDPIAWLQASAITEVVLCHCEARTRGLDPGQYILVKVLALFDINDEEFTDKHKS